LRDGGEQQCLSGAFRGVDDEAAIQLDRQKWQARNKDNEE
jgi:hypothetical protein